MSKSLRPSREFANSESADSKLKVSANTNAFKFIAFDF